MNKLDKELEDWEVKPNTAAEVWNALTNVLEKKSPAWVVDPDVVPQTTEAVMPEVDQALVPSQALVLSQALVHLEAGHPEAAPVHLEVAPVHLEAALAHLEAALDLPEAALDLPEAVLDPLEADRDLVPLEAALVHPAANLAQDPRDPVLAALDLLEDKLLKPLI